MRKYIILSLILTTCLIFTGCRNEETGKNNQLQDITKTISDAANSALEDGNRVDSVTCDEIYGEKRDGSFYILISDLLGGGDSADDFWIDSNYNVATNGDKRALENLYQVLYPVIPENSAFYIEVSNRALVSGVIFSEINDDVNISADMDKFHMGYADYTSFLKYCIMEKALREVNGLDNAYIDFYDKPVGVLGSFTNCTANGDEYLETKEHYEGQTMHDTFQEALDTIDRSVNREVLLDYDLALYSNCPDHITGSKSGDRFTIIVYSDDGETSCSVDPNGTYFEDKYERVAQKMWEYLIPLPNCSFYIKFYEDTFGYANFGVIYTTDTAKYPTGESLEVLTNNGMITAVEGYDNAYSDKDGVILGVTGLYK